jgi:hypothetical protein
MREWGSSSGPYENMSLLRRIQALILENASSMGLRSGEYGGKQTRRTTGQYEYSNLEKDSVNNTNRSDCTVQEFPLRDGFEHCP